MKRKIIYFLYSGYVVFLVGLLGSRFADNIGADTFNLICLFIFIGILAFFCGGFASFSMRQVDTVETIKNKLESRNDPFLIKELFVMLIPLAGILVINYFC